MASIPGFGLMLPRFRRELMRNKCGRRTGYWFKNKALTYFTNTIAAPTDSSELPMRVRRRYRT